MTVRVWNLDNYSPLSVMYGHTDTPNAVQVTKYGKFIVSAGHDGQVIAWDFYKKKPIATYKDENIAFNSLCISHNRDKIYAAGQGFLAIKCWSFFSNDEVMATKDSPLVKNYIPAIKAQESKDNSYSPYALKFIAPGIPEALMRFSINPTKELDFDKLMLLNELFFPIMTKFFNLTLVAAIAPFPEMLKAQLDSKQIYCID